MSNQELLDVYTNGLKNWNELLNQHNKRSNKHFLCIKNVLKGQYVDKGDYIIVQYQNIRAFLYNNQGVGQLEEPFAMIIDGQIKYHITTDYILREIKKIRLDEH